MTESDNDCFNKIWSVTSTHPISIFYTAVPKLFTWFEYITIVTGINLLGKASGSTVLIAMSWAAFFVFAAYTQLTITTIFRVYYQRFRSANQASSLWKKIIPILLFLVLFAFVYYVSNELADAVKVAIEKQKA